jgi:hypothetical protein
MRIPSEQHSRASGLLPVIDDYLDSELNDDEIDLMRYDAIILPVGASRGVPPLHARLRGYLIIIPLPERLPETHAMCTVHAVPKGSHLLFLPHRYGIVLLDGIVVLSATVFLVAGVKIHVERQER